MSERDVWRGKDVPRPRWAHEGGARACPACLATRIEGVMEHADRCGAFAAAAAIAYRPADRGKPDARTDEHNFIVDAWVRSYNEAHTAGIIQIEDWFRFMIPTVEKILDKPEVETAVAYVPGVTDHVADVIGFLAADPSDNPPLVYYVFVKEHYRRGGRGRLWAGAGVGRGLFAAIGIDPARPFNYVCSTKMCRVLERKIPLSRWQVQLGRYPKSERRNLRR